MTLVASYKFQARYKLIDHYGWLIIGANIKLLAKIEEQALTHVSRPNYKKNKNELIGFSQVTNNDFLQTPKQYLQLF